MRAAPTAILLTAILATQSVQFGCTQSEPASPAPPTQQKRIEPAQADKSARTVRPKRPAHDDRPISEPAPLPTACDEIRKVPLPNTLTVSVAQTPVFIQPRVQQEPLTRLPSGVKLPVVEAEGDWFLIRFDDRRWDKRVGYVHCSDVVVSAASLEANASQPSSSPAHNVQPPAQQPNRVNGTPVPPPMPINTRP